MIALNHLRLFVQDHPRDFEDCYRTILVVAEEMADEDGALTVFQVYQLMSVQVAAKLIRLTGTDARYIEISARCVQEIQTKNSYYGR